MRNKLSKFENSISNTWKAQTELKKTDYSNKKVFGLPATFEQEIQKIV